jgi:hypothetical protein
MNDVIAKLTRAHLLHTRYSRYGETIEGDYYEFEPEELEEFVGQVVAECIRAALDERVVDVQIEAERDALFKSYLKGNNAGVVDAVVAIKQRFGINTADLIVK